MSCGIGRPLDLELTIRQVSAHGCHVFSGIPRLLISVRNSAEALAAVRGGADIIDVKEPGHGSLGRASIESLQSITDSLRKLPRDSVDSILQPVPLSIALGEVQEWSERSMTMGTSRSAQSDGGLNQTSDRLSESISQLRPDYLKLGLAQLTVASGTNGFWKDAWVDVRCRFSGDHRWVAVAYADHERAHAPCPKDVFDAALETNCTVLLIDTFVKDGTSLLDWLTAEALSSLRRLTSAHGLQLALAGKITLSALPSILPFHPDIIAVRGAVCETGERTAAVCEPLVAKFAEALRARIMLGS